MKKKYRTVDESYFKRAKKLMEAGFSGPEIVETIGGSIPTLHRIKKATDFSDYKKIIEAYHAPQAKKEALTDSGAKEASKDIKLEAKFTEVNAKLDSLSAEVREMLEAYKWVVEHAQIDYTKKKARWF